MMAQEITRRGADHARIETPKNLDLRLDRLMSFISHYQDLHRGETPTVDAMANEMGTTHQTIRYWLGILEVDNRIRRISQNPLRLMVKEKARPIELSRKFDENANGVSAKGWAPQIADLPEKRQERFEAAEARRFKLARFIGEHWAKHGEPPALRQMMQAMGSTSGAIITAMLEALHHRGIIKRESADRPYCVSLTESGLAALGMKKEEKKMETQQQEAGQRTTGGTVVVVREKKKRFTLGKKRCYSATRRHEALAKIIDEHYITYTAWPQAKDIRIALGYRGNSSLYADLREMAKQGLVLRLRDTRYSPWRLTDKGRETLLLKPEPQAADDAALPTADDVRGILKPEPQEEAPVATLGTHFYRETTAVPSMSEAALRVEIRTLKQRLAEALTANAPEPQEAEPMSTSDMILHLIDAGYIVKRGG